MHTINGLNSSRAAIVAAAFTAMSAAAAAGDVSIKIRTMTGARTRVVWSRLTTTEPAENGLPADADQAVHMDVSRARLYGIDTDDGLGVRCIRDEIEGYTRPMVTHNGDKIVYTDSIASGGTKASVYSCNFDGTGKTFLTDGHAAHVWIDASGNEWVYVVRGLAMEQGMFGYGSTGGDRVVRYRLDNTSVNETVWQTTNVYWSYFSVSADGSRAGGAIGATPADTSTRTMTVALLPDGALNTFLSGCWPCIAPDDSYDFFSYVSGHRSIFYYTHLGPGDFAYSGYDYISLVPSASDPDPDHAAIAADFGYLEAYHPIWSINDPEYLVFTGPLDSGHSWAYTAERCEIYISKFNGGHTGLETWVRITDDTPEVPDYYPSAWIDQNPLAGHILSFVASEDAIGPGDAVTLTWSTTGGTGASIDQGIGPVALNGWAELKPADTTTFTLTLDTLSGPLTKTVTVDVRPTGNGTGILMETWQGIPGTSVTDLTQSAGYPDAPAATQIAASVSTPVSVSGGCGTRLRGFLMPPYSGEYVFAIAGKAGTQLLLSTTTDPVDATVIAEVDGWTFGDEWDKYASQTSSPVELSVADTYYIEVIHKSGTDGGYVNVRWELPTGAVESPIPFHRVDPYVLGPPTMAPNSTSMVFVGFEGENVTDEVISVMNAGTGTLDAISAFATTHAGGGWLSALVTGAGNAQSITSRVDTTGMTEGVYSATVTLTCANASNSPLACDVQLTILPAKTITLESPTGGETWIAGCRRFVSWSAVSLDDVELYVTTADTGPWDLVGRVMIGDADWGDFVWQVPDTPSPDCRVVVRGYLGEVPATSGLFEIVALVDTDGDTMDDGWEALHFSGLTCVGTGDADDDGLTDAEEFIWGADPHEADTDGDGLPDGWEVSYELDPGSDTSLDDPDGDGAANLDEFGAGTDPLDPGSRPASDDSSSGCGTPGGIRHGLVLLWLMCAGAAVSVFIMRRRACAAADVTRS